MSSLMYNSADATNIYNFYQNVDVQSHAFILLSFQPSYFDQLPSRLTKLRKEDSLGHI